MKRLIADSIVNFGVIRYTILLPIPLLGAERRQ